MEKDFQNFLSNVLQFFSSEFAVDVYGRIGKVVLFLAVAVALLWLLHKIFSFVYKRIHSGKIKFLRSISFRTHTLVTKAMVTSFVILFLRGFRFILTATIIYKIVILCLLQFPFMESLDVQTIASGIIFSIFIGIVSVSLIRGVQHLYAFTVQRIEQWRGTRIQSVKISSLEVFSEERIAGILRLGISLFRFLSIAFIVYFTITLIFDQFEITKFWSAVLVQYIFSPFSKIFSTFVEYLPSLFSILVIIFVTHYAIRLIRFVFTEIEKGTISLPGFHAEWIQPTFQIARFLIIIFAVIVIFPYLPGSNSPFFQGISVFLGLLFSLGSSSAISNIVAGVVITYMRPFKIGDKVKIADTVGNVVEKSLLVTRIRTVFNVDITIPNSMVLGSHIINYSSHAQESGLILHTAVTIGYDVPWRTIYKLLISAALKTEHVLVEPKPFVLQTSLNDYHITYEVHAYTKSPNGMAEIYSELHQNIQDAFNKAGVEIMSPAFTAVRNGNTITIPEEHRTKNYEPPAFEISLKQKKQFKQNRRS